MLVGVVMVAALVGASQGGADPAMPKPAPTERASPISWDEVLEQNPDPKVVTDADFLKRITETKLPWRVTDKATGIEMLLVPPGKFVMVANTNDEGALERNNLLQRSFRRTNNPNDIRRHFVMQPPPKKENMPVTSGVAYVVKVFAEIERKDIDSCKKEDRLKRDIDSSKTPELKKLAEFKLEKFYEEYSNSPKAKIGILFCSVIKASKGSPARVGDRLTPIVMANSKKLKIGEFYDINLNIFGDMNPNFMTAFQQDGLLISAQKTIEPSWWSTKNMGYADWMTDFNSKRVQIAGNVILREEYNARWRQSIWVWQINCINAGVETFKTAQLYMPYLYTQDKIAISNCYDIVICQDWKPGESRLIEVGILPGMVQSGLQKTMTLGDIRVLQLTLERNSINSKNTIK